jgi:adenylate cyclase
MLHSAGRFVGHDQIDVLLSQAGQAGFRGHEEHVTVLFSDLRGFTSVSEKLEPEVLIEVLNRYLAHMTHCIEHFGGRVDKFIGDAVMAVFSLPTTRADDADRAVAAALYMEAELERFNRTLPEGVARLAAGVGLHTGRVVAGLIGSPRKRSYTVIGDAVNTASRLEGMTKHLGAPTIISGDVQDGLQQPDRWLLVPLGRFRPKGRRGAVEVLQLRGERDGSAWSRAVDREIAVATEALARFQAGHFKDARERYDGLARAGSEDDGASAYVRLAAHAAAYEAAQPGSAWDGTIELTEK